MAAPGATVLAHALRNPWPLNPARGCTALLVRAGWLKVAHDIAKLLTNGLGFKAQEWANILRDVSSSRLDAACRLDSAARMSSLLWWFRRFGPMKH